MCLDVVERYAIGIHQPLHQRKACAQLRLWRRCAVVLCRVDVLDGDRTPVQIAIGRAEAIPVGIMAYFQTAVPARSVFQEHELAYRPVQIRSEEHTSELSHTVIS